jgi:hypothetical protein
VAVPGLRPRCRDRHREVRLRAEPDHPGQPRRPEPAAEPGRPAVHRVGPGQRRDHPDRRRQERRRRALQVGRPGPAGRRGRGGHQPQRVLGQGQQQRHLRRCRQQRPGGGAQLVDQP